MNKVIFALPILLVTILLSMFLFQYVENVKLRFKPEPFPYLEFRELLLDSEDSSIFTSKDFAKEPIVVNIFNSNCKSCIIEHPYLMILAKKYGVKIYGIAFMDNREQAIEFLKNEGNPYERVAITSSIYDFKGLDVRSTPTSFVLDANGMIRYRHKGIIFEKTIEDVILPIIRKIEQEK